MASTSFRRSWRSTSWTTCRGTTSRTIWRSCSTATRSGGSRWPASPDVEDPDEEIDPETGLTKAARSAGQNAVDLAGYRANIDAHWRVRVPVTAGVHEVAAAFLEKAQLLTEATRTNTFETLHLALEEPSVRAYGGGFAMEETRSGPYLAYLTVTGPFLPSGPGDTESRRRIFTCRPTAPEDEGPCAAQILSTLARRAYRRPPSEVELDRLLTAYRDGRHAAAFDAGIERAVRQLLVEPGFLYRIEGSPPDIAPDTI